ncbi:MAG: DUF5686 and carboxypeptidase regulatory-like domain-containing protein [Marinilabiliales bacterium]|nr:DUF5686 and carboxypeptidase regulatory-like domain-containing protein [Marinilabiliales bacterium]
MRDRILIIIITVIFPWLLCNGQVIRGTISDNTGIPMASASIYITELRQGTTTNSNGFYEISLPAGTYTINYQFLGYLPVTRVFTLGTEDVRADITLTEQLFEIPAVRVSATGKDPAYFIMRKAIGMAPFHLNQVKEVQGRGLHQGRRQR